MLERYISLQLVEQRMRLWLLMSLRGGTCVETKGCACRPYQTPSARPLVAPPALSVTDQEQSAGPFLVAWLDWGRSLQLAGLSVTGGGRPQRLSLADTSDRQGTASADRFIKWHFLQLGLQKWGLGFVKSPSLQGPRACWFRPKLCCYDKFFDLGCLKSALFSPL